MPFLFTVAYSLFDDVHFSSLFAVLPAVTAALIVNCFPAGLEVLPFKVIFVTPSLTILILILAVFPLPSFALAVMLTVLPIPAFFVVTTPLVLTVA